MTEPSQVPPAKVSPTEAPSTEAPSTESQSTEAQSTEVPAAPAGSRRPRRARWLLLAALLLLVGDALRPPERQLGAKVALSGVRFYQRHLSHRLSGGRGLCRFHPTCSNYGRLAVAEHGWAKGGALTAWRVLRCGPWAERGTVDFPPGTAPEPASQEGPEASGEAPPAPRPPPGP